MSRRWVALIATATAGLALALTATPPAHASAEPSAARAGAAVSAPWTAPLAHYRLTSCFGPRWGTTHEGIDMVPAWQADGWWARAASAGVVVRVGWWATDYGISVLVDHGGGAYTHYAHLARSVVRVGQRVGVAQTLGRVGSTGDSTGAHLHFEVWRDWWGQVNPAPWLRGHGVRMGC